jgi:hypothetical protein
MRSVEEGFSESAFGDDSIRTRKASLTPSCHSDNTAMAVSPSVRVCSMYRARPSTSGNDDNCGYAVVSSPNQTRKNGRQAYVVLEEGTDDILMLCSGGMRTRIFNNGVTQEREIVAAAQHTFRMVRRARRIPIGFSHLSRPLTFKNVQRPAPLLTICKSTSSRCLASKETCCMTWFLRRKEQISPSQCSRFSNS